MTLYSSYEQFHWSPRQPIQSYMCQHTTDKYVVHILVQHVQSQNTGHPDILILNSVHISGALPLTVNMLSWHADHLFGEVFSNNDSSVLGTWYFIIQFLISFQFLLILQLPCYTAVLLPAFPPKREIPSDKDFNLFPLPSSVRDTEFYKCAVFYK